MTSGPVQWYSLRSSRTLDELAGFLRQTFGWPACEQPARGATAVFRADGLVVVITWSAFDPNHTRHNVQFEIQEPAVAEANAVTSLNIMEALRPLEEELTYRHSLHWWLYSRRALHTFTATLAKDLALPAFELDAENENEWGIAEGDHLLVHVSRAYSRHTYHRWNPKQCPPGANYSVAISIKPGAPAAWDAAWLQEQGRPRWQACLGSLGTILDLT